MIIYLCYRKGDSLGIPPGWLCYLAPELVRSLHAHQAHNEDLPFGKASDLYAFGYEIYFVYLVIEFGYIFHICRIIFYTFFFCQTSI